MRRACQHHSQGLPAGRGAPHPLSRQTPPASSDGPASPGRGRASRCHAHARTHPHPHSHSHPPPCSHPHPHPRPHTHTRTHTHPRAHTHAHTHTHTCAHTHTHAPTLGTCLCAVARPPGGEGGVSEEDREAGAGVEVRQGRSRGTGSCAGEETSRKTAELLSRAGGGSAVQCTAPRCLLREALHRIRGT